MIYLVYRPILAVQYTVYNLPYSFFKWTGVATWCRRFFLFLAWSKSMILKRRFKPWDCKDIQIIKLKFVVSSYITWTITFLSQAISLHLLSQWKSVIIWQTPLSQRNIPLNKSVTKENIFLIKWHHFLLLF